MEEYPASRLPQIVTAVGLNQGAAATDEDLEQHAGRAVALVLGVAREPCRDDRDTVAQRSTCAADALVRSGPPGPAPIPTAYCQQMILLSVISSMAYPNTFSAAGLINRIVLLSSIVIMASEAVSATMR